MKLSLNDQDSVVPTEGLRFAANSHSYSETPAESTSFPQETRDNGDDGILMVER